MRHRKRIHVVNGKFIYVLDVLGLVGLFFVIVVGIKNLALHIYRGVVDIM